MIRRARATGRRDRHLDGGPPADDEHAERPASTESPTVPSPTRPAVAAPVQPSVMPAWALRTMAVGGATLALAAVVWLVFWLLFRLPMLTFAVAVAVLLTALSAPVAGRLRRVGVPGGLAALGAVLLLLGVLAGIGFLIGFRAAATLQDLTRPLAAGIDRIRVWLIEGPLQLDAQQVADVRNDIVTRLYEATPSPGAGAQLGLFALGGLVLIVFLVFFLLKDGAGMWAWLLARVPDRSRARVDGAGLAAWDTLAGYVRGVIVVALIDAVGIGLALLVLGVPLWLSLTLLTFIGAFVPIVGATVSGAVAVLVTLVTNGVTDAVIVLVVVLVVQQVEGNVLQPLIMGRAVRLHPVVILLGVTAGGLVAGVPGALLAVPMLAVVYRVVEHLRTHPASDEPLDGSDRPLPAAAPPA
ncbi:AI-2E family transporter [Modestobacter sp. VKM Ac-2979]|uniref:AI-2E family transporter n=1 Tax=unclassified Modestobacter TaxID=2643866 RepID=UPI0022ABB71C|nr:MULTISPECIES: AI-2E family transporter [unclassified Modestobacter]MCZ2813730.1 AI-2E family transporter [Modestobacter sp. VKM Ac-2979]MCZ2844295.1 AI-2E family transporter [Modestobacter sp. VKM Ac-2980]